MGSQAIIAAAKAAPRLAAAPELDVIMLGGFLIGILTLLYWMHRRSHRYAGLGFSICLMAMAMHSFMTGAWQVGVLLVAWSIVAFKEWRQWKQPDQKKVATRRTAIRTAVQRWDAESRLHRLFGPT